MRSRLVRSGVAIVAVAVMAAGSRAPAVDLYKPPINYETATADNAVARLQKALGAGKAKLAHEKDRGYLTSLLAALDVPESSQVLVFSKTSLQRGKISPQTPRAIYFNDDVYVGFCVRGDVMEISVADPALGTAFYSLDQKGVKEPRFQREGERCLLCHASKGVNLGIPGHLMRSGRTDRTGEQTAGPGAVRTLDSTPFAERWGGWYVTGRHGKMEHLGNQLARARTDASDPENPNGGQNITDLKPLFPTEPYLTPHSDIVALMVLAHQSAVHNRIAGATLETRSLLYVPEGADRPATDPAVAKGKIAALGDELLRAMLFSGEAKLTDRVTGTSDFAERFAARGPFDKKGRSLREFDLAARLFKYPCSFLIYTDSFDRMPAEVRGYVLRRLHDVLTGTDTDKAFAHLGAADRKAILEILRDTKPGLPAYWRE